MQPTTLEILYTRREPMKYEGLVAILAKKVEHIMCTELELMDIMQQKHYLKEHTMV